MTTQDLAVDGLGLAGAGLVSYGAWLVYPPAGFIVMGALLLIAAWRLAGAKPLSAEEAG